MTKQQAIILYFTSSGTTRRAANAIAQMTDVRAISIQSNPPYPSSYDAVASVGKKQLDEQIHPQLNLKDLPDLTNIDQVYIGFPTWWQQPPMIIHSLFEKFDFSGKTIIPFTTSMSTPMADSMPFIQKMTEPFSDVHLIDGIRYVDDASLRVYLTQHNLA